MIISEKHKFIFIALYKNASTTIETSLTREKDCYVGGPSDICAPVSELPAVLDKPLLLDENGQVRKHIPAREIRHIMGTEYAKYFKFAVVRNPWDRVVSHYKYNSCYGGLNTPFSEWCKTASHIHSNLHGITDESGKIIVDTVLYFENLQAAFNPLCERIGLEPRKLGRLNTSQANQFKGSPYTAFYDKETKEIVREKYKDDIDVLKYSFKGMDFD